MTGVVLLSALPEPALARAAAALSPVRLVSDLNGAAGAGGAVLLSFCTGVIVPPTLFSLYRRAYNLHPASPDFPGRDPHHWAVYEGAVRFGATLHVMTERVDAGPIIDVELFDVAAADRPSELMAGAVQAGLRLIERRGAEIASGQPVSPRGDWSWGSRRRTRRDLIETCRLAPEEPAGEVTRKVRAFGEGPWLNLHTEIGGVRFRLKPED